MSLIKEGSRVELVHAQSTRMRFSAIVKGRRSRDIYMARSSHTFEVIVQLLSVESNVKWKCVD